MLRQLFQRQASSLFKSTHHCTRHTRRRSLSHIRAASDPLKILFCGADDFSIHALRALHDLRKRMPESIASIDVVCRPDKRVGRGLKKVQEVPIKSVAKDLHLPLHQIDTFTGWSPPSPFDLVIAVSFGLLVPERILKAAKYGGLNVHPSLLPDFRGPAPIQHTLLQARSHTGVTLQTMHPTRFDDGMILAQTSPPGVPVPGDATPDQLVQKLGVLGAEMLCTSVADGIFASPKAILKVTGSEQVCHAPKITPEDREIDWENWTADQIMRRDRVLGRLWDMTTYQACYTKEPKRVTFGGPWREVPREPVHGQEHGCVEGMPTLSHVDGPRKPRLALHTVDKKVISPANATIEGEQKGKALSGLVHAVKSSCKVIATEDGHTGVFQTRL